MRTVCNSTEASGNVRVISQPLISLRARLSVFPELSSALYRMDAVVTLHTSDNYGNSPQTCHQSFVVSAGNDPAFNARCIELQ